MVALLAHTSRFAAVAASNESVYAGRIAAMSGRSSSRTSSLLSREVGEARQREAELEAKLKRSLAKAAKRGIAIEEELKPCTAWAKAVALRVYVLADGSAAAALRYLTLKHRAGSESEILSWHSALSADGRAALASPPPGDKAAGRQMAEAKKFMSELKLVGWVEQQNLKGLAPTSNLVISEASSILANCRRRENKFRWVRQCMQRWKCRKARIRNGKQLSQEELRRKAASAFAC